MTTLGGMYLSYYVDIASGASIVLCAALLFAGTTGGKEVASGATGWAEVRSTGNAMTEDAATNHNIRRTAWR